MADEGFERKLTAILSADVEGYSRLMDDDEAATVRTLTAYRTVISDLAQQYSGRVVDSPGDNILAEFKSVVDAVNCAVEIQRELAEQNADLPDKRKMQFRIGVNLGDVIDEEERIYGDGVNIAARIESLSEAGGICISHSAYDQIKNKLKFGYEYLGEHKVKNIREPVKAYRVLTAPEFEGKFIGFDKKASKRGWIWVAAAAIVVAVVGLGIWQFYERRPAIEAASEEKMAYPLPDKPSIAVLAFDNLSGDPQQEYFCDGLSEGIINGLAKNDRLFVIARNSTFTYKGKPTNVKQIAEDLGVRYILEGSIQKANDKVRITAQLIDALSGYHLFSERYERELKDIFRVQDEITKKVLTELLENLTLGTSAAPYEKGTDNLDAYLKVMQARDYKNTQVTKERVLKSMQLLEEAIALDPEYAPAYSILSTAHFDLVTLGASDDPKESLRTAIELGNKAIALDESNPSVHAHMTYLYIMTKNFDKAFEEAEKAVSIAPNYAGGYFALGFAFNITGQHQKAIPALEKCLRLSPMPIASNVLVLLANSYLELGKYEEAIATFNKALHIFGQDQLFVHIGLARTYVLMDREEEARASAAEIMRIDPDFSIARFLKPWPMSKDRKDRIAATLRKAGLPEHPPLPLPDKPSIAVLAFDNLSGDPEQEFFSDGITEEIISSLSKTDQLFVIARNSSFVYKGKPVNVKQVARELGVRYVLEGSVRKSEDQVRVTAQLIDATTGHHLWSERYDRDLKDIFAVQDEITMKIIAALQVELTDGEQMRIWAKRYKRLDVLLKVMELISISRKGTRESITRWGQVAQEVVDMAPESPLGYRHLGWYHFMLAAWGKSPRENLKKAYGFALKAISLDEYDGMSHGLLGNVYLRMRQHEKAIAAGKRAIELFPNGADVHMFLGYTLNYAGRPDEAIGYLNKALRLNPFPPWYIPRSIGHSYFLKGQYEKALPEFKKALQLAPKSPPILGWLAVNYILLGREEEARASADKALELFPNFSVSMRAKTSPYKNQADLELHLDAMRKAGFPE